MVATLTLKRMTDNEIIEQIQKQTGQTVTRNTIYKIRQNIKKDSYQWYKSMREDSYSYLHEFKERVNEIVQLQQMLHSIIDNNKHLPSVQINAISELHKLNITLSNYIEVLPTVINNNGPSISVTSETKTTTEQSEESVITV